MIRAARSSDTARIATLFFESMPAPWTESAIDAALRSPTSVIWVWEEDGMLCGALILQVCMDEAEILTIATAQKMRRRGIARSLVEYALREIGREVSVFLEVRSQNRGAQAFYTALGFLPYGVRKRYYREPVDDAVLMKFGKF